MVMVTRVADGLRFRQPYLVLEKMVPHGLDDQDDNHDQED